MNKLKILIAITLMVGSLNAQHIQEVFYIQGGYGKLKTNIWSQSANFFRIQNGYMKAGNILNYGGFIDYYASGLSKGEIEVYEKDEFSKDIITGVDAEYFTYQKYKISNAFVFGFNFGGFLNRYIVGNYFDGGLYGQFSLSLEMMINFGDYEVIVYEDSYGVIPKNSHLEAYDDGGVAALFGGLKIGYTIPLSKRNLDFSIQYSNTFITKTSNLIMEKNALGLKANVIEIGVAYKWFF